MHWPYKLNYKTYLIINSTVEAIFEEQAVLVIILTPITTAATVRPVVVFEGNTIGPFPGALYISISPANPSLLIWPGVPEQFEVGTIDNLQAQACCYN